MLSASPLKQIRPGAAPVLSAAMVPCPIGWLLLYASAKGLQRIDYANTEQQAAKLLNASVAQMNDMWLQPYRQAIMAYFSGIPFADDLALDISSGTDLQRRVWHALRRVPYGQSLSYSELAAQVGKPQAVRAVASACGKNPIALIIPCHRILAKSSGLGGFSWGLDVKRFLLAHEGIVSR